MKAILILGSPSDLDFASQITDALQEYEIPFAIRIASAHKTPHFLLDLLAEYEKDECARVYITVAGRSNALSGMVDAAVQSPVIACPPYSEKYGGSDLYSSLRTPSGVAPAVVLEPQNAALLAAKILSLTNPDLKRKIVIEQEKQRQRLFDADAASHA